MLIIKISHGYNIQERQLFSPKNRRFFYLAAWTGKARQAARETKKYGKYSVKCVPLSTKVETQNLASSTNTTLFTEYIQSMFIVCLDTSSLMKYYKSIGAGDPYFILDVYSEAVLC